MNIRYSPGILQACKEGGLRTSGFDRREEPQEVTEEEGRSLAWGVEKVLAGAGEVPVILTDLYPNRAAFAEIEAATGGRVRGWSEPVSAFDLPPELTGFRTLLTGFHHFRSEQARRILADAVAKRAGIAVFEGQERAVHTVILIPVFVFLAGVLFTPFAGRVTWQRLVFTYLIPICPLAFAWDGFVSCLRTYSPAELRALTRDLESPDYRFEIGKRWLFGRFGFPYRATYLIGLPQPGPA